jgi:hypothetical protein|tara:strand:- start:346 stop:564 length:219 start_codon:yes stop_codon:yes gene_type:complete
MKYLLVVYFLLDGQWVQGEASKGWGAVAYESQETCLASKARAEGIHTNLKRVNPRALEKRFECVADGKGRAE